MSDTETMTITCIRCERTDPTPFHCEPWCPDCWQDVMHEAQMALAEDPPPYDPDEIFERDVE